MKKIFIIIVVVSLMNSCSTTKNAIVNKDPIILPRSSWNAAELRAYKQHGPVRITVHHEGTKMELRSTLQNRSMPSNARVWVQIEIG